MKYSSSASAPTGIKKDANIKTMRKKAINLFLFNVVDLLSFFLQHANSLQLIISIMKYHGNL